MTNAAPQDDGFSILEVIVALAIVALVSGAFYQATGTGAHGISVASRMAAAVAVAQSRLNEAAAIGPNAGLATTGEDPSGVRWNVKFSEREVLQSATTGPGNRTIRAYRIDVDATWIGAPHQPHRTVNLTSFVEADAFDAAQK